MTNDELKALCESNARAIAATNDSLSQTIDQLVVEFIRPTAQQTLENARGIADLKQSLELSVKLTDDVASESADNENRIEANESRFDTLVAELRAERARSDERFTAQMAEIRALGEQNRALLSALATTNGRVDSLEKAG